MEINFNRPADFQNQLAEVKIECSDPDDPEEKTFVVLTHKKADTVITPDLVMVGATVGPSTSTSVESEVFNKSLCPASFWAQNEEKQREIRKKNNIASATYRKKVRIKRQNMENELQVLKAKNVELKTLSDNYSDQVKFMTEALRQQYKSHCTKSKKKESTLLQDQLL